MAEFIQIGEEIVPKPKLDGISYDLVNGKVYDLLYDRFEDKSYLKENGELNMPKSFISQKTMISLLIVFLHISTLKILVKQQVYYFLVLKVLVKQCSLNVLPQKVIYLLQQFLLNIL